MLTKIHGANVLLTGASGGLGVYIAKAFASEGANLLLTASPGIGLAELLQEVRGYGVKAESLVADLRLPEERAALFEWVNKTFNRIDILVNNAGIEHTAFFDQLHPAQIQDILGINLSAPMMLTRSVLKGMTERKKGHIVNISSLAGRAGPACQETYAATKAGLVAFTYSLRASYRKVGVSASVICPGFVEAGIYSRIKERSGKSAPPLLAACRPEKVADAVIRVIKQDSPEVIVSRFPVRPLLVLISMFPSLGEWVTNQLGAHDFFESVATSHQSLQT